jgi:hypothetical protein
MNRDRVKIAWKLDRHAARRKFGYKRKSFTRSKTWASRSNEEVSALYLGQQRHRLMVPV